MQANEIMVGDWVRSMDEAFPVVIQAIHNQDDVEVSDKIDSDDWRMKDIAGLEPIPITAEILKQNGIVMVDLGDNGPSTPPRQRNRHEKWFIHTTWRDTHLWFDRITKKYNLADMRAAEFEYVHELQHALRMVGIEAEIKL